MAIASKWMAATFNRPGFPMFGFDVYALAGDGCLMEGVSGEAASLAGHLKLDNLCWIYDNNHITIEGETHLAFSEDVATRFMGYGWDVTRVTDANDLAMLDRAFDTARKTTDRPTLIIVDSHIGYGAPHKQDTHAAHGEPLGEEEIKLTKRFYGWPEDAKFLVPDGVREHFAAGLGARGAKLRGEWMALFEAYKKAYPEGSRRALPHAAPPAPRRLGQGAPHVPRRREGRRRPRRLGQGAERGRAEHALAHRRLGRPGALHQDAAHLRRRGRLRGRRATAAATSTSASASTRWARS